MTKIQDLFSEINTHLLEDEQPSAYFNEISKLALFEEYPFNMLDKLKKTEQSPKHHPEGNVWNHTMLVIDQAAKVKDRSKDKRVFMWAALLHDIGKPDTTMIRKGRITSYDHDKLGAELTVKFLSEFTDEVAFIKKVSTLVRWHMQILFVINNLPFADVKGMKSSIDINEVALFGFCDRMGRTNAEREKEEENIKKFIEKCK
jgi:putative nucleotidyltransferase with HDIG domain